MSQEKIIKTIENQQWLDGVGDKLQPAVLNAFESAGEAGKQVKNFLHGTWLGHPLHTVLTDIPIGAWSTAAVLDTFELAGVKNFKAGADASISIGLVGAVGSAVTGLTDWTGTSQKKRKIGLMHGLLNLSATALYFTSMVMRKRKSGRKSAIAFSMAGYGISMLAAYLGGHLVFGEQMGVDHTATSEDYPKDYVPVLAEKDLKENAMVCVQAGEIPVLVARKNGKIFAIANTCSHLGGPLCEGDLLDEGVRCPWHQSVFSLEDGSVVEGPATAPQPKFDVRIQNGQIEVRLQKNNV